MYLCIYLNNKKYYYNCESKFEDKYLNEKEQSDKIYDNKIN